jgi:hypothetical protein
MGWTTLGTTACGEDGRAPYAGLTRFESESGLFRVHYLSPPWTVEAAEGDALRLHVLHAFGADAGRPPKSVFAVVVVAATSAETHVLDVVRADRARGYTMEGAVEVFRTRSGDAGYSGTTRDPTRNRWFRHVSLGVGGAGSAGRVVSVTVEANVDPRSPEFDAMLRDVDVRPLE